VKNETLLKIVIGVFAIILIVLGTFAYGNMQRQKQKDQAKNNSAQVSSNTPTAQNAPAQPQNQPSSPAAPAKPATPPATAAKPTPPATVTPSQPAGHPTIPSTGAETIVVIPATLLALLSYLYVKARRSNQYIAISKSQRLS
jgi:cytoskeletal protein RodZ